MGSNTHTHTEITGVRGPDTGLLANMFGSLVNISFDNAG